MADSSGVEEAFRRALDANARYYESLGRVTTEYVRALSEIFSGVKVPLPPVRLGVPAAPATPSEPPPAPAAQPTGPALVLEGIGGQEVRGVFAISNDLTQTVSAPVMSRAVETPTGTVALRASPTLVALEAGQKALVEVGAVIPEALPVGETYRGEISVPGLSNAGIAVVLRRVVAPETPAQEKPGPKKGARKATARAKTGRKGSARKKPARMKTTKTASRKKSTGQTPSRKKAAPKKTVGKSAARKKTAAKAAARTKTAAKAAPRKKAASKKGVSQNTPARRAKKTVGKKATRKASR